MIDRDTLLTRVRHANPLPDTRPLPEDLLDSAPPFEVLIGAHSAQLQPVTGPVLGRDWRGRRRWAGSVVLATAVVTVLLVALPLLFLGDQKQETQVGATVPTTSQVSTTDSPTTVAAPQTDVTTTISAVAESLPPLPATLEITWRPVPTTAFEGGWISAMTEGGPGLVAVGGARMPDVGPNSAGEAHHGAGVWVSVDGVDWERIDDDTFRGGDLDGGIESAYMSDVTVGPNGLVAVGFDGRAAVWLSPDGRSWTRIPHDEAVFGSFGAAGAEIERVARASFGLVAVGFSNNDNGSQTVTSWVSPDGETWVRAGSLGPVELFSNDPLGYGDPRIDLVAWGDMVIVAGSGNLGEDWTYRPAVWISKDAFEWDMIPDDGVGTIETDTDAGGMAMVSVMSSGDGLLALGWAGDIPYTGRQWPVTWRSSDARTWDLVPGVFHTDDPQWGKAVVAHAGERRVLAIADGGQATVFGSADGGEEWHRIGSIDGHSSGSEIAGTGADEIHWVMNDLFAVGDSVLVVGRTLAWSSTEDLGGLCSWDPGDGSVGSCRADAALWIGTWVE